MQNSVKTITFHDGSDLIKQIMADHHTPRTYNIAVRNKLMTLVMLDAGLRVGELVQLKPTDLWFGDKAVRNLIVRPEIAKLHFERVIPVSNALLTAIHQMYLLNWSQASHVLDLPAFYSFVDYRAISVRMVQHMIEKASMKALGYKITPHTLRHTFASRLMRVTNMRVVQQLLGHRRITSTEIYTHPDSTDLTKAITGVDNAKTQKAGPPLENAETSLADPLA